GPELGSLLRKWQTRFSAGRFSPFWRWRHLRRHPCRTGGPLGGIAKFQEARFGLFPREPALDLVLVWSSRYFAFDWVLPFRPVLSSSVCLAVLLYDSQSG